jgi:hypothetical protein
MTRQHPLFLHEEVMLLSLKDEEGTVEYGASYSYAIAGAMLAELLFRDRIGIEETKKSKLVGLKSARPLGDPLLDEALEKIKNAKKRASFQTWVGRLATIKKLKRRVAAGLCKRGILRDDEDKVLLIFTRKIYPEVDPKPEKEVIERLRKAIFTNTRDIDIRTIILLSLANSTGLLRANFDKKKLKDKKKRIEQIVKGEILGKAAREAIEAMQAAIMVSVIMPSIITTTIITN